MVEPDGGELIAGQYADRPVLRPVLDAVLAVLPGVGDVTVEPRRTCVSLVSPRRVFAAVQPTTRSRVDLGLRLVDVEPGGRLLVAKNVGSGAINVRIALNTADDVDGEVVGWLTTAYQQSVLPPTRKPSAPRRQLRDVTSMSVLIEGHDLPGLYNPVSDGEHGPVHVGLWTSEKDSPAIEIPDRPWRVTDLFPGDATFVRWECAITVGQDDDGPDFKGTRVRGDRTDRHLALFWGEYDGTRLHMFRGAKLKLGDVDPEIIAAASRPGQRLAARLGLTDEDGFPVCANRKDIVWSAESEAS